MADTSVIEIDSGLEVVLAVSADPTIISVENETTAQVIEAVEAAPIELVVVTGVPGPQGEEGPQGQGIPTAGTTGQVLQKKSATDYDTSWVSPDVSATANTIVKRDANADTSFRRVYLGTQGGGGNEATRKDYVDKSNRLVVQNPQSGDYTFVLDDMYRQVQGNSATAKTYTVPADSTLAFPVGAELQVLQFQAGTITIAAASPAVIEIPAGYQAKTINKGTLIIRKRDIDRWAVSGDLLPATPTAAEHLARKDYVDGKVAKSGDTMTGQLNVPSFGSIKAAAANNTITAPDVTNMSMAPFKELWHDLFAFNRHLGAPITETSADGTTGWTAVTSDPALFARRENQTAATINGTTVKGTRWTWNSGNLQFCGAAWLVIGHNHSSPEPSKRVLVESSADGVAWTIRHDSTYTNVAMPIWHKLVDNSGDNRFRVTVQHLSGASIILNSMRLLSSRWGNQGGGSENEFPYSWDKDRKVTFARATSDAAPSAVDDLTRKDYVDTKVAGGQGINAIVKMTQVAYDALPTKDANTLYVIEG